MDRHQRALFERKLRQELEGKVLFDAYSRARYSTDASIYQIAPLGVVVPTSIHDLRVAIQIALDAEVPIIPRGAGTSQGGQPIGRGLIIDTSESLNRVLSVDPAGQRVLVEPGLVLETLNRRLAPHGIFFPVDPSTGNRATLGGMAGNNSAGARSIKYGLMADNVKGIEAILADGTIATFDRRTTPAPRVSATSRLEQIRQAVGALYSREREELSRVIPHVLRHVAGYNLHRMGGNSANLAELLVGSEGTLGVFTKLDLELQPVPAHKVLGVCHFPSLHAAMTHTKDIVALKPTAVELVDRTLIELARTNPAFRESVNHFMVGDPAALLLVEFAGEDRSDVLRSLGQLVELMDSLGFSAGVVRATDEPLQDEIWDVRRAALNIVMSMKGDAKPVSFIEDCAVPLEHLAAYTTGLEDVFARHGTEGTWYAHASVGCLHVRPTLNIKDQLDVNKMRSIAEEAHEMVRAFKGSHSGEHGDGIVRSEFIEPLLGRRITSAFEEIKYLFDPKGLLNPGKIVRPYRMDDPTLFRYQPSDSVATVQPAYDWSEWGGLSRAVEMCNNNGACRKRFDGVMCPSYRATSDEMHTTRGRANTLRLALSGQLGRDALTSARMYDTMDLCVGCKACRRECPTGVDMARMKTEFLYQYRKRHPVAMGDFLVAHLPRYAPFLARVPLLANLPSRFPVVMRLAERITGLSAKRRLPEWHRDVTRSGIVDHQPKVGASVALFVDTFSRYFEPEPVAAARRVLDAAGLQVTYVSSAPGERPLCCGRTYLNAGLVDEARVEVSRTLDALSALTEQGVPIIGLEPSCLLTFRDELLALFPGRRTESVARNTFTLEEFLVRQKAAGKLSLNLKPVGSEAVVHGHCHQKAFGVSDHVVTALTWIPDLSVTPITASCCGMAGSFGYEAKHYDISLRMGELDLLPAIRQTGGETWIIADGTSCRAQIRHGTERTPHHAAQILAAALEI